MRRRKRPRTSRAIAEKRRQEEKISAAQADAAKAQSAQARAEGEARRLRVEADSARAEAESERNARKRAEAAAEDANRRAAEPTVIVAPAPAAPGSSEPPQADARKTELRIRLLEQLNAALPARDTPRGLVATVPDASFTGPDVRPPAATGIARLAEVLAAYPERRVAVEGYSDSPATHSQSTLRAGSVRRILIGHGLPADRITERGLGDSRPLASNSTAAGRDQNRRVEIVISGDPIGTLPAWDHTYSLMQGR